jgi:hypothetical protein
MEDDRWEKTGGIPEPQEEVLYRFGPMAVGITFKRPAFFTKTQQNCTEIVMTTHRVFGVRKMPRIALSRHGKESERTVFEFPYSQVLSVERADYLLNKALWIHYREGDGTRQIGIEAGLIGSDCILRMEALLKELTPNAR